MTEFFSFLDTYSGGIWMLLVCMGTLVLLVQWFAWIFSKGRFQRSNVTPRRQDSLRYVFSDAVVKIVNDFRHLLALIVVLIFAIALAYSLWEANGDIANIKEALTAVTATLGGLVGSIIGYYFGESSATNPSTTGIPVARQQDPTTATQGMSGAGGTEVTQAPPITPAPGIPIGESTTKSSEAGTPVARQQSPTAATQGTEAVQAPPITPAPGIPGGTTPTGATPSPTGPPATTPPDAPSPAPTTGEPTGE